MQIKPTRMDVNRKHMLMLVEQLFNDGHDQLAYYLLMDLYVTGYYDYQNL